MSTVDGFFQQALGPLLRPGETPIGMGFGSKVVPMAARMIPILVSAYAGHFVIVATTQRVLLAHASISFMGNVEPSFTAVHSIELSDVARVEPFNPHIIAHVALRFVLTNGIVHELMFPSSKSSVAGHGEFLANFPGWVTAGVANRGFPALGLPPDPRAPALPPPPLGGTWWMLIVGSVLAVGIFGMSLAAMLEGLVLFGIVNLSITAALVYGLTLLYDRVRQRRLFESGQSHLPFTPLVSRPKFILGVSVVLLAFTALPIPYSAFNWWTTRSTLNATIERLEQMAENLRTSTTANSGDLIQYQQALELGATQVQEANVDVGIFRGRLFATPILGAIVAAAFVQWRKTKQELAS